MALGGGSLVSVARIAFEATGVGEISRDIEQVEQKYRSSTGEMSDSAIKLELAQRRLQAALKAGPGAFDRQARAELGLRRAEHDLRLETDSLTAAKRRQGGVTDGLRSRTAGLTGGLAGLRGSVASLSASFLAGGGLLYALKSSLDVASNVEEQMGKTRRVFGDASSDVEKFASTSSRSFQLAEDQALETVSTFGALLRPLDIIGAKSADIAIELTKRGADLASFYNTDVQSALDAVRSGVVGETEPLRRYGALLSEARVRAQALADTGKRNASALTDQEKAFARIALILKDTSRVQGDAAKTGGQYAGQMRRLNAQMRDLQGNVGKFALPAVTSLVAMLNQGTGAANRFASALSGIGGVDIPGGDSSIWDLTKGIYSRIGPWGTVRNTRDLIRHIRAQGSLSSGEFSALRRAAQQGSLSGSQLEQLRQFMSDSQFSELHRVLVNSANRRRGAPAVRGEERGTPVDDRDASRPRRPRRTLLDIDVDIARALTTPGTGDEARLYREQVGRFERQIAALENRKTLTEKQKEELRGLYGSLAGAQSALDAIQDAGEQKIAAQRAAAEEKRQAAREERIRKAEERERRAEAAERREDERMGRIRESAAKAAERRLDLFAKGGVGQANTRAELRRAALRGVGRGSSGSAGGGLTEADVRRMQFEFLTSLQGITNQFGSNIQSAGGAPNPELWQLVSLAREQNHMIAKLASGLGNPGSKYAGTEISHMFAGPTF